MRTPKAGGLNGLRSEQKNVKKLHEFKKALTKIITILKKRQSENLQLKYNT